MSFYPGQRLVVTRDVQARIAVDAGLEEDPWLRAGDEVYACGPVDGLLPDEIAVAFEFERGATRYPIPADAVEEA